MKQRSATKWAAGIAVITALVLGSVTAPAQARPKGDTGWDSIRPTMKMTSDTGWD
jgi:hypothetical protein